jgi:hypothetical protein
VFLNGIVGGWQVGGIWTVQSGLPQTITIGGVDRSNTGVGDDRPIATGISPYLDNPTPSRWYNPAAFVEAPAGSWGNVGRNTAVGPGIFALDFSAHKEFRMPYREGHTLQFRAEGFNAFNNVNFTGTPQLSLATPTTFGQITSSADARVMQFALRYEF